MSVSISRGPQLSLLLFVYRVFYTYNISRLFNADPLRCVINIFRLTIEFHERVLDITRARFLKTFGKYYDTAVS